ncbi:Imm8 family immunity protein [Actinoplanes sp. NPDC026623]|uniref:Imm8 family immunity protein n=1 Tax=Actinoplanes sp. NPDC026623 TaxID=3155610 RepID=UPI00340217BA
MRAVLKSLDLDPDPSTLPADPSEFALLARMIVGPPDTPGEESFDVTVCSPEWLAKTCREVGGIYHARHHLVVSVEDFDVRVLRAWLTARVREVEADTWSEIGERLGRGLLGVRGLSLLTPAHR